MHKRVAFISIGQSPRRDAMPEILLETRTRFTVTERGVLDGLDDAAIADLAPRAHEEQLVVWLRDGHQVRLGKPKIQARLRTILTELDARGFDLLVLLSSADFDRFNLRTPFIEPRHTVDHFLLGLTYGAERIGIMLPSATEVDAFNGIPGVATQAVKASPSLPVSEAGLRAAAAELANTDIILMHCISYSGAMRQIVQQASGRPVLLSRRLLAHAIDLLLS
jgi:protein AroM